MSINKLTKEAFAIKRLMSHKYQFKKFYEKALEQCKRFERVSAYEVVHYMRTYDKIPHKADHSKFKIDNTVTPLFANAFVQLKPEYRKKFVIKMKIDLSEVLDELRNALK